MQEVSYKFGEFELAPSSFELSRAGRIVKLERNPMELLILLVEKQGSIATREEIVELLWGRDVFVDTEHGINTAIRKIRAALGEDKESPRFIQTVPGKGYRFIPDRAMQDERQIQAQPVIAPLPLQKFDIPSQARRRWLMPVVVAGVLAAGVVIFLQVRQFQGIAAPIKSIAVLPIANLSGNASQDYLADGITDELITMLARNTSLRVISRTSVMQYKGVNRPLRDIARELGADAIVEGSVNPTGSRVHLNVQLINAKGDTHIWAESYDRDAAEIYALPGELSFTIAKELKSQISPAKAQRYIKPEAHDAYLRGRYFWFSGNYDRALEFMTKAAEIQPDYASAWAGMADVWSARAISQEASPAEVFDQADAAAHKALALDDTLPDVHNTLAALALFHRWDWQEADRESRRAIELNPNAAEPHHLRAYYLLAMNRHEEAIEEQRRSSQLDPFARPWALGLVLMASRQLDAAIQELRAREQDHPQDSVVREILSNAYRHKGLLNEWAREYEATAKLWGDERVARGLHKAFEEGGEKEATEWLIQQRKDSKPQAHYQSPLELADWYARLQRKEETLKALQDAYKEHSPHLVFLQDEADFDFLHSDPRYRALVNKIGLPLS